MAQAHASRLVAHIARSTRNVIPFLLEVLEHCSETVEPELPGHFRWGDPLWFNDLLGFATGSVIERTWLKNPIIRIIWCLAATMYGWGSDLGCVVACCEEQRWGPLLRRTTHPQEVRRRATNRIWKKNHRLLARDQWRIWLIFTGVTKFWAVNGSHEGMLNDVDQIRCR